MEPRIDYRIAERVHPSRYNHWTLAFTHNNLAPMVAGICLGDHIVEDLESYSSEECLLQRCMAGFFNMLI